MDFEKLRQDAQNQLDQKLAEVDRLAGVAKELEKKNAEAQTEHDELVETLTGDIDSLRAEKAFSEEEVEKGKIDLTKSKEAKKKVKTSIDSLEADLQAVTDLITEKEHQLSVIEKTGEETIKTIEAKVAAKQKEAESLNQNFLDATQINNREIASLTKAIDKAQKELAETEKDIEANRVESARFQKISKDAAREAEQADHRVVLANEEAVKAEQRITVLTQESEIATTTLASLKEEIEAVQSELKPLLAKRIDSINYMKELGYKEANLRKKYEDVGLEYN